MYLCRYQLPAIRHYLLGEYNEKGFNRISIHDCFDN
jgi:hypothetical protein